LTPFKRKQEVGIYAWQSQYQNDPGLEEGAIFKAEWIQHFDQEPQLNRLEIVQGVDLAISEKSTADYFVIATVGFERQTGSIYLLDLFRDHITFLEQQNKIQEYARKWNPQSIAIEENAYQKAMIQVLDPTYLPVVGIKQTRDKIMRMQALTPHFENRKVWIRLGMEDFETELLQFPRGDHDDTLDAFEMAVGRIRRYDPSALFDIIGAKRPE
jgi:predicted phage terminase large subunit-like protein